MTKKKHVQLYVCDSVNVILFLLGPAHAKVIRTDQDNVRVKQVQTKHVKQKRKKNEILMRRDHAYACILFPKYSYYYIFV